MSQRDWSFAELLDPVRPETFFAENFDRKPLHVPGGAEKFAALMSWDRLNALLNMSAIWIGVSLELVLVKTPLAAARYCRA